VLTGDVMRGGHMLALIPLVEFWQSVPQMRRSRDSIFFGFAASGIRAVD
jgi:hypothetical protein